MKNNLKKIQAKTKRSGKYLQKQNEAENFDIFWKYLRKQNEKSKIVKSSKTTIETRLQPMKWQVHLPEDTPIFKSITLHTKIMKKASWNLKKSWMRRLEEIFCKYKYMYERKLKRWQSAGNLGTTNGISSRTYLKISSFVLLSSIEIDLSGADHTILV